MTFRGESPVILRAIARAASSPALTMSAPAPSTSEWRPIRASRCAMRTTNPIRALLDKLKPPAQHEKQFISLSLGDPTVFGNLSCPENVNAALTRNIAAKTANGYTHSAGIPDARKAIAERFSKPAAPLTMDEVIITSSCSGALEIALGALVEAGKNVLLPAPGFSVYQTILESKGAEFRHYKLIPERNWEIDLEHLKSLVDENTVAVLITNPSNPCGSVFSEAHLRDILAVMDSLHLPLIADEIYGDIVFGDTKFVSAAEVTQRVPVLSVGGLAKQYLVPGWRVGWILIHDRSSLLAEVRDALFRLTTLILGANTLVQSVIREALHNTPPEFYSNLITTLSSNANELCGRLKNVPGLKVIVPSGAMYMMLGIDIDKFADVEDDLQFTEKLLSEENLYVLPGRIFHFDNYVRLILTPPPEMISAASERIDAFCRRHLK